MSLPAVAGGDRIARAFGAARAAGRCALVPYVTAGDPDLGRTRSIVGALARAGADVIEIGVPFSDPIADGEVIQRAAERALRNGVTLRSCLDLVGRLRADGSPPLVLFTYYNPIHRMGVERFVAAAAGAGVDGVLVTDLPPEESEDLRTPLAAEGIGLIYLASPTSSADRLAMVAGQSSGFLYLISRTGVTGARQDLPPELEGQIRAARRVTDLPLAVGFGISRREQVAAIAPLADGVVVGSALVRLIGEHGAAPDLEERVAGFLASLRPGGERG